MPKTDDNTAELILEHLREIRRVQDDHGQDLKELKHGNARIRQDIHDMRGDDLRFESTLARVADEVKVINKRLGLVDA